MKIKVLSILLLLIAFIKLNAQSIDNWIEHNEKLPVEKLFIHTDKEFYFSGEEIWFKTYLSDSRSGLLIPGTENIYINLIDENGISVLKSAVISANGLASGSIFISEDIKAGTYLIEAFTDYLLNFSANTFFHKPINISRVTPSVRLTQNEERFSRVQEMVGDVSFLPEGGILLANISNLVAFKAINRDGYGVEAKGTIRDENGNVVTEFKTDYKGMGLFFFTPESGKSYTARISGFPAFKYNFKPIVVDQGIKIQLANHTNSDLIINIAANTKKYNGENFYLVNMNKGEIIFYHAFKKESQNHILKFNNQNLIGGINRLVLLDNNLKPISERLVFSDNLEVNKLQVRTGRSSYNKRTSVNLKIDDEKLISIDEFSNLSVSILNKNAISPFGISQNILSYSFINSELNGFIEQSADYFKDSDLSSTAKLRLLMLTNGWSSYLWNSVPNVTDTIKYRPKVGIDIKGTAYNSLNENPIKNGEITLIIEKDKEMAFLTQNTDEQGKFSFQGLLFNDSAKIFLQARNKRGKMNTDISLSSLFPEPISSKSHMAGLNSFYRTPYSLKKRKYESDLAFKKFDPYYKTKNIAQVDVIEKKPQNDNRFRIYDEPDFVLEIPKNEASHSNVLEYMSGKVTGLDIFLDDVKIRGISAMSNNSTPLFLLDGIPILTDTKMNIPDLGLEDEENSRETERNFNGAIETVKSIPMQDIEKVEILKSPQKLALFGSDGANGVIAIYTHSGTEPDPSPFIKGLIEKNIQGYASNKKFYSPKYTPENQNALKPDLRTTLFWEPEITTENGAVNLNFFTSDQTGHYTVFVEGITNKGKISLGSADFEVVNKDVNSFGQLNQ